MERRAQAGDRKIDVDPLFERVPGKRAFEPTACIAVEQPLEPVGLEADRDHDEVVGDPLHLVTRLDRRRPTGERAKATRLPKGRLGLQREDAAVSALQELATVPLRQAGPFSGVRVEAVLVVALTARVED